MRIVQLSAAPAAVALLIACSSKDASITRVLPPPSFVPTATIQDLMDSEIDPSADFIWGSVGTIVTAAGTEERRPRSDEGWKELRRKAIILVEAANLLLIPGRQVTSEDFSSAGPGVLSSDEIEHRLRDDPASFGALALGFREVALSELRAIDHKDVAALSAAGEALDKACEACHLANWYPHEIIPPLPEFKQP